MRTLIITDKPLKFKDKDTTIANCMNKYADVNGTIVQLKPMRQICGIRANKVIIYEPSKIYLDYPEYIRYKSWLRRFVIPCTSRDANFAYVIENKVLFTGGKEKFYDFIKEEL